MSQLERTIFQIMTDNGMSEESANCTIANMSIQDMQRYLKPDDDTDVSNAEDWKNKRPQ